MDSRNILVVLSLVLICSSALADEQVITVRPGYGDRLIIEQNGRAVGTARPLYGDTWVVEDMNGRDRAVLHDTEVDCDDNDRTALSCLFGGEDD